jgi:hypothetical protein
MSSYYYHDIDGSDDVLQVQRRERNILIFKYDELDACLDIYRIQEENNETFFH